MEVFITKIIDDYEEDLIGTYDTLEKAKEGGYKSLYIYDDPIILIYKTILNKEEIELVYKENFEE